jgi:hypothetical protein
VLVAAPILRVQIQFFPLALPWAVVTVVYFMLTIMLLTVALVAVVEVVLVNTVIL